MFIKDKPIRFRFKIWMLYSSSRYPYAMEIYSERKNESSGMPLGEDVVTQLLSKIADPSSHEIKFDNFFTSHNLLKKLSDFRIRTTGTVRSNRIWQCPLPKRPQKQLILVVMELYSFTDEMTTQL
ncbi:piggyBac transposable element-derived protein 3 [Nephila pilipes]|uniref:PiggyBac transposable element-derived protein 3 n=1 Tax=Nephila pilipes TaxID=299642 RepID=A0A8X6N659_NEPPI|nr:piggyBac transposable element-derived protein 3 [Nephila pilipes]